MPLTAHRRRPSRVPAGGSAGAGGKLPGRRLLPLPPSLMLLSLPTWIIHLLTVTEWLAALLLFHRYGVVTDRVALRRFAWAMLPHLLGGGMILLFHASGDRAGALLTGARLLTFTGSLLLLAATLALLSPAAGVRPEGRGRGSWGPWLAGLVLVLGVLWGTARLVFSDGDVRALLPGTHAAYLTFLGLLLWLHRRAPGLIPPLSILGFWFLLPFVVVTIITTHIATVRLGLPSLAHADALHGASEALLSVGNLLIATGVWRRLREQRGQSGTAAVSGPFPPGAGIDPRDPRLRPPHDRR